MRTHQTDRNETHLVVSRTRWVSQLEGQSSFRALVREELTFLTERTRRFSLPTISVGLIVRQSSGVTLNGAPTAAGRAALQTHAAIVHRSKLSFDSFRPELRMDKKEPLRSRVARPLTWNLAISLARRRSDLIVDQGSVRIDHRLNETDFIYGRYRSSKESSAGSEQVTPPGLGTLDDRKAKAAAIVWTIFGHLV